jgi:DUF971 family protein
MPTPTEIKLLQKQRCLVVQFDDGQRFELPCQYLRVFSPSAEVRGHGGPMKIISGKDNINIEAIEAVGHYAVRLTFDDGHNTGIYSWETLYSLGENYQENWHYYLQERAKLS